MVSGGVYGELLAVASPADIMPILQALSIDVDFTMPRAAVERAAIAWTRYLAERRPNGHARVCAAQLLTWDRGVYHTYFTDLATVHP